MTSPGLRFKLRSFYAPRLEQSHIVSNVLDAAAYICINNQSDDKTAILQVSEDLTLLIEQVGQQHDLHLHSRIQRFIQEHRGEIHSLLCCVLRNNQVLISNTGNLSMYLSRGGEVVKLIGETTFASGEVKIGDRFIICNREIETRIDESIGIGKVINLDSNELKATFESTEDVAEENINDTIVIFDVIEHMVEKEQDEFVMDNYDMSDSHRSSSQSPENESTALTSNRIDKNKEKLSLLSTLSQYKSKRTVTIALLCIIFSALLWSIFSGLQRKSNEKNQKEITFAKELVMQKISQAKDVAFLNQSRSTAILNEAQDEINSLKAKKIDQSVVDELQKILNEAKGNMLKKEDKSAEEFYDLSLENKNSSPMKMVSTNNALVIVDSTGYLYKLSVEKKSIDKYVFKQARAVRSLVAFDDTIYVLTNDAVYSLEGDSTKKLITKDKEWGNPVGIEIYNNTIYLLDKAQNQIQKYAIEDDKGVKKVGYFNGNGPDVASAQSSSFAIDSSIYISTDKTFFKYTLGTNDKVNPQFPSTNVLITKVLTNSDVSNLYVWDKSHSLIYVFTKDGMYKEQIQSKGLGQAMDVAVHNDNVYLLYGKKILKISLQ